MLMMEMQKRSELSSYLPKDGDEFFAQQSVQQQTTLCAPKRGSLVAMASARKLITDDDDDDDNTFVFPDTEGNYGFRTRHYRTPDYNQANLHDINLSTNDAADNREQSHHGGIFTSIWTSYHDRFNFSKRTCRLIILAVCVTVIVIGCAVGFTKENNKNAPSNQENQDLTNVAQPLPLNSTENMNSLITTLLVNLQILNTTNMEDHTSAQFRAVEFLAKTVMSLSLDSHTAQVVSEWRNHTIVRPLVEAYTMAVLYYSTNGASWKHSGGWATYDTSPCRFQGVICAKVNLSAPNVATGVAAKSKAQVNNKILVEVITNLTMSDYGLSGTIPTELGFLLDLQGLDLSRNRLAGHIPSNLSNLKRLRTLALEENELKGSLADTLLEGMSELKILSLYQNFFTGTIPASISSLSYLEELLLGKNRFSGTIPDSIGDLYKLNFLRIGDNRLVGRIPETIGKIPKLWILDLAENSLTGSIPTNLTLLSFLVELHLYKNKLTGTIPENLDAWYYLTIFSIELNYINGTIPESLMYLTYLRDLQLGRNQLTGSLPETIGQLTALEFFQARQNLLLGTIPSSLGNLVNLQSLYLDENKFTGTLPDSVSQLTSLLALEVHSNSLTGTIPTSLCPITKNHLKSLTADCNSELNCTCCTTCF